MMLLLLGMVALVFFATLAFMDAVGWAVLMVAVVLVGGAVLGASVEADID